MIRSWDYSNSFGKGKEERKEGKKEEREGGRKEKKEIFWCSKERWQAIILLFWENIRKRMKYKKMYTRLFYNVDIFFTIASRLGQKIQFRWLYWKQNLEFYYIGIINGIIMALYIPFLFDFLLWNISDIYKSTESNVIHMYLIPDLSNCYYFVYCFTSFFVT